MNKSLAAIPLLIFRLTGWLAAQPVLTEENSVRKLTGLSIEANKFTTTSTVGLAEITDLSGPNQTWDMDGLELGPPTLSTIVYSLPDGSMPAFRDPRLSNATLVAVTEPAVGTWTYHRIDESGHFILGRVTVKDVDQDGLKDTLLTTFDPVSTMFPFPLDMGTTWTDSTTQMLEFHGSPPVPVETDVAFHTVDGWGTLATPHGSFEAIRISSDIRIVGPGGQRSEQHIVRVLTPIPDGLTVGETYASGIEISFDDQNVPISLIYLAHAVVQSVQSDARYEVPPVFSLGPNYPNPFPVETTIPFVVERPGPVRVSVIDMLGRRAAELLNRSVSSGLHRVTWNAAGAPSGVYLVLFEMNASSASQMVVLRK